MSKDLITEEQAAAAQMALFEALTSAELRQRRSMKWSVYPEDVLPAWVAEMDFPLAPPIVTALSTLLTNNDLGYPCFAGDHLERVSALFATRMLTRYGFKINPRQTMPLVDVVQGLALALELFTKPGEGVIVQPPIYPPFMEIVKQGQRQLLLNPLVRDPLTGFYNLDVEGLKRLITKDTKLLFLCNPHNPSGRVFTREELQQLADIALEHKLLIVADEIHAELSYPGHEHLSIAALGEEIARQTITLTSATKAFSIPGLRFALAYCGSEELFTKFKQFPLNLRGGVNSMGLAATIAAWEAGDVWLKSTVAYLSQNREFLGTWAEQHLPPGSYYPPEATYLAWIDTRALALGGGADPAQFFLEHAKVALSPGKIFGPESANFVRLNFATSQKILQEIGLRLSLALAKN